MDRIHQQYLDEIQMEGPMPFKVGKCSSCGRPVIWAETEKGRRMPMDAEPKEAGAFLLEERGWDEKHNEDHAPLARYAVNLAEAKQLGLPLYTSHFATCKFAEMHRRRAS